MKFRLLAWVLLAGACGPTNHRLAVDRLSSPNPAPQIAAFCVSMFGRRVGNGECWTLADEAFKSAGARRPGTDPRVWGRVVNPAKESLRPGDIVEFRSARFSDGIITGPFHTAVVVKIAAGGDFSIAEQNWGGKSVRLRLMNLNTLRGGKVMVYRPR